MLKSFQTHVFTAFSKHSNYDNELNWVSEDAWYFYRLFGLLLFSYVVLTLSQSINVMVQQSF